MPPARTGVAIYSTDLVAALQPQHEIDVFVDEPVAAAARTGPAAGLTSSGIHVRSAHDFVWRHHRQPYDLTVYQLGNSSAHDFLWPYLFRYPGLAVLHDARLHHARAAALLRRGARGEYRDEFAASQPSTSRDLAELAIAGFDNHLYYQWPLSRLISRASRLTAVHAPAVADELREASPEALIETIRLGHGRPVGRARLAEASARVRTRHGLADDAVLIGVFGGLTPEKRLPRVLAAFAALLPYAPAARLLLVGAPASHYDVAADVERLGMAAHVTITGYVEDDEMFTDYVAASEVSVNLRWPTAREVSGPWVHALAAGRATIITDLVHMSHVPALDPRTWRTNHVSSALHAPEPVTVAIDLLDEAHSLGLALRRLATDAGMRARLGCAGASFWQREHSMAAMLADYERILQKAMRTPAPRPALPRHLSANGTERLEELMRPFGIAADVWSRI